LLFETLAIKVKTLPFKELFSVFSGNELDG
jgi:hypothetical protein